MTVNHHLGPLFTDLYELTMAAGYFQRRMFSPATFSLYIRNYPPNRSYFVAAGLEDALRELAILRFSEEDLAYLKVTGYFSEAFLSYLRDFRFSGEVVALPEGTIFFAGEPILEVTAPLIESQILETFLLNTIGFQTLIASKAARCLQAADGRALVDFSLRRCQGHDAGMKVARSTYLAGFDATSNVLAGKQYGIPISGTMAHSYVQAFGSEREAFSAFAELFADKSVFLIDTYDTLEGARAAVTVAREMRERGHLPLGVRLDSGDMAALSRQVRELLDAAGFPEVKIFASSGFDEFKIAEVIAEGACIDAFGVGTSLGVSADAPFVDIVYKMVRAGERNVRKFSPGKQSLAGCKQVFRFSRPNGMYIRDLIGCREERVEGAVPLLEPVMSAGAVLYAFPPIKELRRRFLANFQGLDRAYQSLEGAGRYPVEISSRLRDLQPPPAV